MAPSVGVCGIGHQGTGGPATLTTSPAVNTQGTGSFCLVFNGPGGISAVNNAPSDNKSNSYSELTGSNLGYPNYSSYGTAIWSDAIAGGTGHTWSVAVGPELEGTLIALEIIGADTIENWSVAQRTAATGGANGTFTSNTVAHAGDAVLVCILAAEGWFTADPTATGWTLQKTWNGDSSSVQASVFTKVVTGSGSEACTIGFTGSDQGANVYIFAIKSSTNPPQVGGTLSYTAAGGAVAGGAANARGHIPGVAWESVGTIAYSTSGGSTVAPGIPAGLIAGNPYDDALIAFIHEKPATANGGGDPSATGWTILGTLSAAGGFGSTLGADTGNTYLWVAKKDTVTGAESGTQSFTLSGNGTASAQIHRISKQGTGAWLFATASGQRTSTPTSPISIATTAGLDVAANDLILTYFGIPTDVTTPAQFSSETLTQTGVTFGTVTEDNEPDTTVGNDLGGVACHARATAGSGSGAITWGANITGTLTNVRGPLMVLRAREATPVVSTQATAGGAVAGGASTEKRTLVQPSSGGGIAGGALAALKRTVVAATIGGAVAGGVAGVTTATGSIQTVTYSALGGAVAGGASASKKLAVVSSVGGGIAGASAVEKRIGARVTTGGGVAGGSAIQIQIAKVAASSGAVAGGAATEKRASVQVVVGGGVGGGSATVTINAPSVLAYAGHGGGVAGGSVIEKRQVFSPVSGGGIGGGSSTEKRTVVTKSAGGAVAGGSIRVGFTRSIVGAGGGIAGGSATEKRSRSYVSSGGAVAGASAQAIRVGKWIGVGGGVAGGDAPWSSSAPIEFWYGSDGGGVAGGSAATKQVALRQAIGGAVAGGAAQERAAAIRQTSGGAIAGGSAAEHRVGARIASGGAVAGGISQVTVASGYRSTGGGIAGGTAQTVLLQSGYYTYIARGGAIAGGTAPSTIIHAGVVVTGHVAARHVKTSSANVYSHKARSR